MHIADELAAFLASPVMLILGTTDGRGRSAIGRAIGVRVDPEAGAVELVFSAWQWPKTAAHLRAHPRLAATFARPSDYVSYQIKGPVRLRSADPADLAVADAYIEAVAAVLGGLGLERRIIAPWLQTREALVARMQVEEVFVQTPGAGAGRRATA